MRADHYTGPSVAVCSLISISGNIVHVTAYRGHLHIGSETGDELLNLFRLKNASLSIQ
jgi:hypothetical protein